MDPTLELETFTIFCRSGERHSSAKEVAADQLTRADDAAAAAAATGSLPFWDVGGKSRKIILFFLSLSSRSRKNERSLPKYTNQ